MTGVQPLTRAARASTSPTIEHIRLHSRPVDHTANDFVTIKLNGFTKVTERKPRRHSQNRERRLDVPIQGFATKAFSETAQLSPTTCCEVVCRNLPIEAKMRQSTNVPDHSANPNGSEKMTQWPARLVLVGAGKMGGAMAQGWLDAGVPASSLTIVEPNPSAEIASLAALAALRSTPTWPPRPRCSCSRSSRRASTRSRRRSPRSRANERSYCRSSRARRSPI